MKVPAPGGNRERAGTSSAHAKCTACTAENPAPPVYVLKLEPLPRIDGARALRELLKRANRNHGLVCRGWVEERPVAAGGQPVPEGLLDRRAAWLAEAERRSG